LPLLLLLAGCHWRGPQTLPFQMVGEWRTAEPRYHGRFLRLETNRITFGLGGVAPDKTEHVERVNMAPSDNSTDYTIRLKAGDGTDDSIVLQFTPQNGGELCLKSQPKVIWKRKSESARTQPSATPQHETPPHETPRPETPRPETPRPETPRPETPRPETPPPNRTYGEHMTIYKIDCIRPKVCRSF
jgi:hypothetical protein